MKTSRSESVALNRELAKPESLFRIEESLEALIEGREYAAVALQDVGAHLLDGESEQDGRDRLERLAKDCERGIAEYLTKEAAKVSSYAALIRRETFEAEQCAVEIKRLTALQAMHEFRVRSLKDNAKAAMERFNVKELRSPTCSIKLVGNGGVQPLDVESVSDEWCDRTVKLPCADWDEVGKWLGRTNGGLAIWHRLTDALSLPTPNNHRIREALNTGAEVPGARLLPRGSHVEVK